MLCFRSDVWLMRSSELRQNLATKRWARNARCSSSILEHLGGEPVAIVSPWTAGLCQSLPAVILISNNCYYYYSSIIIIVIWYENSTFKCPGLKSFWLQLHSDGTVHKCWGAYWGTPARSPMVESWSSIKGSSAGSNHSGKAWGYPKAAEKAGWWQSGSENQGWQRVEAERQVPVLLDKERRSRGSWRNYERSLLQKQSEEEGWLEWENISGGLANH